MKLLSFIHMYSLVQEFIDWTGQRWVIKLREPYLVSMNERKVKYVHFVVHIWYTPT